MEEQGFEYAHQVELAEEALRRMRQRDLSGDAAIGPKTGEWMEKLTLKLNGIRQGLVK